MKKIIELADLHIDPVWIDKQKKCLDLIESTGKKNNIDAFVVAGDTFNRHLYATDKSSYSIVINFFKSLLSVAPVVAISGTKSHDGPGCYAPLEGLGVTLLKPGKPQFVNDILFIGLPEVDKIAYMNKNKCTAEQAHEHIVEQIENLVDSYYAPAREMHSDKKCVFVGHGMYFDNFDTKDIILQNTDIPINNSIIAKINADRYVLGHIHKPKQFEKINGGYVGYMGYDRSPWNNTGFQTGFNLTELSDTVKTTRIDYPVTRRERFKINKITDKAEGADVKIKYKVKQEDLKKLDISSLEIELKEKYKMNSCEIALEIEKNESGRIDLDEFSSLKSLRELYSKFDSEAEESVLQKIDEIEKNINLKKSSLIEKKVSLLSLTVHGSIFSISGQGGDTFRHEFSKDPHGLSVIYGPNGSGKSSFMGFANTHPCFLGFDYRTLKDFFLLDDSYIEKIFDVNGERHRHLIQIRKSKIECFWYCDDQVFFKSTSLKEFNLKCDEVFGNIETFVITNFHVQEPHRMKKIPSICSASKSDLRDVYMQIVGIDRTYEKEYAKQKKDVTKQQIHDKEIELQQLNKFISDKDTIIEELDKYKISLKSIESKIKDIVPNLKSKENELSSLKVKIDEQKLYEHEQKSLENQIKENKGKQEEIKKAIEGIIDQKVANKYKIQIEETEKLNEKLISVRKQYMEEKEKLNEFISEISQKNNSVSFLKSEIKTIDSKIESINKPCENCGYIKNDINTEIEKLKQEINNHKNEITVLEKDLSRCIENKKNIELKIEKLEQKGKNIKSKIIKDEDLSLLKSEIKRYENSEFQKTTLESLEREYIDMTKKYKELSDKINPFLSSSFENLNEKIINLKSSIEDAVQNKTKNQTWIESTEKQLEKVKQNEVEITKILKSLDEMANNHDEWEAIEKNFSSNKIPALELDVIAKEIDVMINSILPDEYIIETRTQEINKKGDIVDRFDIIVYDSKTGIEKSLPDHSPGQKAWLNEAVSYALREKRQKREKIFFDWSFDDEIDGPLNQDQIQDYYNVLKNTCKNRKRYVVSHSSEAFNFAENKIDVRSFVK